MHKLIQPWPLVDSTTDLHFFSIQVSHVIYIFILTWIHSHTHTTHSDKMYMNQPGTKFTYFVAESLIPSKIIKDHDLLNQLEEMVESTIGCGHISSCHSRISKWLNWIWWGLAYFSTTLNWFIYNLKSIWPLASVNLTTGCRCYYSA